MILLEIEAEDPRWDAIADRDRLLQRAADAMLSILPEPPRGKLAATLLLADDEAIRALNGQWRGQDRPTNVLSFPCPALPGPAGAPAAIGDVVLAYETVAREAAEEGKTLSDHAAHLVVHGLLHLLGHDHLADAEADAMERLEVLALERLGIADPYRTPA